MNADLQQTVVQLLRRAESGEKDLHLLRNYALQRKLGEGGMGAVFLLRHEANKEYAALKLIRPGYAWDSTARSLFRREVANTNALRHPHVITSRGAGTSGDTLFLLMDYCDGGSVKAHMDACGGKLPPRQAMDIAFQALDALAYAHEAVVPNVELADGTIAQGIGLVHRDLKPDNLFLVKRGRKLIVKVADFGLAKAFLLAERSGKTKPGDWRGTPEFMPRHQVYDALHAGPEVDVWALAATLYNMLTGKFPREFVGQNKKRTILHTHTIPIRERDRSMQPALADVIDKALDDTQEELPIRSAGSFKQALEAAWRV